MDRRQAFTSADVVFTFDQALHSTALNKFGLPLAGVTANGAYGVTIDFTKPAYTDAYYALGRVEILPEHIWQSVKNPTTFLNAHPVGTGAYVLSKFTPQVFELTANPHYYMPGLPKFKTVRFISYSGNTTLDAAIEAGQLDWTGAFIPNIKQDLPGQEPEVRGQRHPAGHHVPGAEPGHRPDHQAGGAPGDQRRAEPHLHQRHGLQRLCPGHQPRGADHPELQRGARPVAGQRQARPAPTEATAKGRRWPGRGVKTPLNITVKMVAGYTDYLSDLQIIQQELKPAGINLVIDQEAYTAFISDQDNGDFQLLIDSFGYTPDPWSYYYTLLDSAIAPAIGKADTVGNYGRYRNPKVDSPARQIAGTTDTAAQKPAFYKIEHIVSANMPHIPLLESQNEIEFDGRIVGNIPTVSNPYAAPAMYIQPDIGWIAARLAPASMSIARD